MKFPLCVNVFILIYAARGLSIKTVKRHLMSWRSYMESWELLSLTTTAHENLSDGTRAEMFMNKVKFESFIHDTFGPVRRPPSSLLHQMKCSITSNCVSTQLYIKYYILNTQSVSG